MYGEQVQDVEEEIRTVHQDEGAPLLLVVGSEKVSFDVYEAADWNVGVTNQPHSEVAGLAVSTDCSRAVNSSASGPTPNTR